MDNCTGLPANPFELETMAAGYAQNRPPLHACIVKRAWASLGRETIADYALDIGCGAGLSTKALDSVARMRIGMDPSTVMLKFARTVAPGSSFIAGVGEAIAMKDQSLDLMTAAGSLNYTQLDSFFREALRVLKPAGTLIVYDFLPGRTLRKSEVLDYWFCRFVDRYPQPVSEAQSLSPEILSCGSKEFRLRNHENFEIGLSLSAQFYVNYMLTETNVAAAIRRGTSPVEIRSWCEDTIETIWNGQDQEVVFKGYFACMERNI